MDATYQIRKGGDSADWGRRTTERLLFLRDPGNLPEVMGPTVESNRLRACVRGAVQGVGFRPFVYRLATELGLSGWVKNTPEGVIIEVEGSHANLERFLVRLSREQPPRSAIQSLESAWLDPAGYTRFDIRPSQTGAHPTALVLPDIATCPDCRRELTDPANRRYFYPFTNCTNCGPRFSIIRSLPYDRPNTSMAGFVMCVECTREYADPTDRRFHAQPNACHICGPHLELWVGQGRTPMGGAADPQANRRAIVEAAAMVQSGRILALKGLGGFHLLVDARNAAAIRRLRELKHREEKPFAVMFNSLLAVKTVCEVSPLEERLLCSPEAPIVLLRRKAGAFANEVSEFVAPGNRNLGVMLPYTPLHILLLAQIGGPVVATSGNLSDEPICIDELEAVKRLGGIADFFLVHNRPIVRHVDDSIARILAGREQVLRRARGYAPLPVQVRQGHSDAFPVVLAVGAHLKNTISLAIESHAFVSQHIGDLETEAAYAAFEKVISDFQDVYAAQPDLLVADAHPDYLSSAYARRRTQPGGDAPPAPKLLTVQHHVAHALACVAENGVPLPALGVAWDGTGYGLDGTVCGGEFFRIDPEGEARIATLRPFRLPGGEKAIEEPRRSALGVLYEIFGSALFGKAEFAPVHAFDPAELNTLETMLARNLNSPVTTSAGRLFDAVAAILSLRQVTRYEGQAAMELEFAAETANTAEAYVIPLSRSSPGSPAVLDWEPMLRAILNDLANRPAGAIAGKFHNALADSIVTVAQQTGLDRIVLSGGCFQNRYLAERTIDRLRHAGLKPYWHQRVPPNDGGISLGQIVAARRRKV